MQKTYFLLLFCLPVLIFFQSCHKSPTELQPEETIDVSYFTIQNYPRIDGSTSTHPLQIVIACNILGVSYHWYDEIDGTRRLWPDRNNEKKDIRDFIFTIQHNGTHGSYVNLIQYNSDIILTAREPSTEELDMASSRGINITTRAIALDAFVFILNTANPVENLSVEQIQKIYTGNIINWKDVGGPNAAINPYQRNKNSGSQELMETLVMKNMQMVDAPQMILYSMMGPINKLMTDPNGLGYNVYFFNQFMAPRTTIKVCGVNGVKPDINSVSKGKYIYTTQVFAAIRSNLNTESTAYHLWEWLGTVAGQEVIAESGYVPFLQNK